MTRTRRIALALSAVAFTAVSVAATAPAANADITWGYKIHKKR